jgi:hypothetical protein
LEFTIPEGDESGQKREIGTREQVLLVEMMRGGVSSG